MALRFSRALIKILNFGPTTQNKCGNSKSKSIKNLKNAAIRYYNYISIKSLFRRGQEEVYLNLYWILKQRKGMSCFFYILGVCVEECN